MVNGNEPIDMQLLVVKVELREIEALRSLFLAERSFQFTYNKCHLYGWADTYLFLLDDNKVGYGSVWGKDKREARDSAFEFYITEPFRKMAGAFFSQFHAVSGASFIECQSNDPLLTSMLFEHSESVSAQAILFEDHFSTEFVKSDVVFERRPGSEDTRGDDRQYILRQHGEIVASGGLLLNYNMPYADLYYDVNEHHRQKGLGSFMVQELKKEAYLMGRVPAARCNINNQASKATLLKAGFRICGWRLCGKIR